MRLTGLRIALTLGFALFACGAASAKRIALVIGNQDYSHLPDLQKVIGDVDAMDGALTRLRFSVKTVTNVDHRAFVAALRDFANQVSQDDEVVIHYSGHGIAVGGRNFLVPTDLKDPQPGQEALVTALSIDAIEMVEGVRAKQPRYVFTILDACRDNPFDVLTRSALSRGLSRMEANAGAFLLFSAGPGEKALDRLRPDDPETTSVFTRILLKHLEKPGLSLQALARTVQREVRDLAGTVIHSQFPDYSDRTIRDFFLNGDAPPALGEADILCRAAKVLSLNEGYVKFRENFPTHPCAAEFTALIDQRADEAAFEEAVRADTLAAWRIYGARPNARRAAEAAARIAVLTPPAPVESAGAAPLTLLRTLEGHTEIVHAVAVAPDGATLASGGADGAIKLWDVATGKERRSIPAHGNWVASLAFASEGRVLASGSWDQTLKSWDPATGRNLRVLSGHANWITATAVSPDGRTLASASRDQTVRLWDAETGALKGVLDGHEGYVTSVAFSPDGKLIASGSRDATVKLWDVETRRMMATLKGHNGHVYAVAFSPDGTMLASGAGGLWDTSIKLWEVGTGKASRTLGGHSRSVRSLAFLKDGKSLVSAGNDSAINVWDVATGKRTQSLSDHKQSATSIALSPDGRLMASASNDKTVKLWAVANEANAGR